MMRSILFLCVAVLITAHPVKAEDVVALGVKSDAGLYSFATSASQKNGAVFGIVEVLEDVDSPIEIVKAEADVAERVELHTHLMEEGRMMMREVESYTVAPDKALTLKPMGHHIMLFDLKAPLVEGESFDVILYDKDGIALALPVLIRAPGDMPKDHSKHH